MGYIYDKQGQPIEMEQFAALLADLDYKIVGRTKIGNAEVSTVWLGIDHNFMREDSAPLIFETMIFGGGHDEFQWRWHTEEEAIDGHDAIVEALKEDRDPEEIFDA